MKLKDSLLKREENQFKEIDLGYEDWLREYKKPLNTLDIDALQKEYQSKLKLTCNNPNYCPLKGA